MMRLSQRGICRFAATIFSALWFCAASQNVTAADGPISWNGTVNIGGGWGRMVHLTNGNWLCVTTQFPAGTNSYLRVSRSTDNCRTWATLANVKEARTLDNGELIQLPNGTVLLTMRSLILNSSYELHVYASADNGTNWVYRSNIDTSSGTTAAQGKGLWEPDSGCSMMGDLW